MGLSAADRRRFARQLSLREVGEDGQERLLASEVAFPEDADPGARAVAEGYLLRAGMRVAGEGGGTVVARVPTTARVRAMAGDESLLAAARSLAGALAAVSAIKAALGLPADDAIDVAPALRMRHD